LALGTKEADKRAAAGDKSETSPRKPKGEAGVYYQKALKPKPRN